MARIKTRLRTRTRAYGDGSIVEYRPGRFRVLVSGGRDPISGKRIRLTTYAATAEDARAKKAELLAQRLAPAGPVVIDRELTVAAYLEQWAERKRDVETTHHFRLDKLRPVKRHLGQIRLHALTDADVDHLINVTLRSGAEALAPQTRKHVHSVLRKALKDACEHNKIRLARNPCLTVEVKGYREDDFDPRVLDDAEYDAFLKAARRFDQQRRKEVGVSGCVPMEAAWTLFWERGLREGELLGLRWSDVDLADGTIRIHQQIQRRRGLGSTKGKKKGTGENLVHVRLKTKASRRKLRLTPRSLAALKRHRVQQTAFKTAAGETWNARDMVFCTVTGIPLQGSALTTDYFRPVCRLAAITYSDRTHAGGLRIHDLRHTCATRHLKQHWNVMLTKMVMGHSSVTVTERYLHLAGIDEDVDQAVE